MASPPAKAINRLAQSGKPIFFGFAASPAELSREGAEGAVRVVARTLSGMQKEALVDSGESGLRWRLASDEGAYLAGLDAAPCPLSFFTVGLISSLHGGILALARARGLPRPELRLVLDSYYTMRGSALAGTMTGGARDPKLFVLAGAGTDRAGLATLVQEALLVSPVAQLLHASLPSRFALQHNGHALDVAPLPACADAGHAADDLHFDQAQPVARPASELIRRGAMTEKVEHTVTMAGGSLAAEQDRVLHVRGVSALRPDGLLEVEQHLYNPHGSIFRFLCDPAPTPGAPRAPTPQVYASAGIAFCFMTQFGRFASIARLPLSDCRIVQETCFDPGSTPVPVETVVRLRSGASDEEARRMLAISEQTCFLHALCKSTLKIRLSLLGKSQGLPAPIAGIE